VPTVAIMAAGNASVSSGSTKCALCPEDCVDNRTLPCHHAFCLSCIEEFSSGKLPQDSCECPSCRRLFVVPDGGVCNLPQNHVIRDLLSLITCSACKLVYTDPRSLACAHTFCSKCIAKLIDSSSPGNKVECPLCKSEILVPDNGVSGMPKNLLVEKLTLAREADAIILRSSNVCGSASLKTEHLNSSCDSSQLNSSELPEDAKQKLERHDGNGPTSDKAAGCVKLNDWINFDDARDVASSGKPTTVMINASRIQVCLYDLRSYTCRLIYCCRR
jgi:hypothetical protein